MLITNRMSCVRACCCCAGRELDANVARPFRHAGDGFHLPVDRQRRLDGRRPLPGHHDPSKLGRWVLVQLLHSRYVIDVGQWRDGRDRTGRRPLRLRWPERAQRAPESKVQGRTRPAAAAPAGRRRAAVLNDVALSSTAVRCLEMEEVSCLRMVRTTL